MNVVIEILDLHSFQVLPYHIPFEHFWTLPDIVCKEIQLDKKNLRKKLIYEEHINLYPTL